MVTIENVGAVIWVLSQFVSLIRGSIALYEAIRDLMDRQDPGRKARKRLRPPSFTMQLTFL